MSRQYIVAGKFLGVQVEMCAAAFTRSTRLDFARSPEIIGGGAEEFCATIVQIRRLPLDEDAQRPAAQQNAGGPKDARAQIKRQLAAIVGVDERAFDKANVRVVEAFANLSAQYRASRWLTIGQTRLHIIVARFLLVEKSRSLLFELASRVDRRENEAFREMLQNKTGVNQPDTARLPIYNVSKSSQIF